MESKGASRTPYYVSAQSTETGTGNRSDFRRNQFLATDIQEDFQRPDARETRNLGVPSRGEVRGRWFQVRFLVPSQSHGGQFVVDHGQVPEIDVRVGP